MKLSQTKSTAILTMTVAAATTFFSQNARASFTVFDNFNSYTANGNLIGQGPSGDLWTRTIGTANTNLITATFGDGLATFVGPTSANAAYRGLAGLTIPNASTASTVFFQFRLGDTTANNWNFVVTDVAPVDTAGSSEVQFNLDNTAGNFRARNAGAFKNLSIDGTAAGNVAMVANTTYSVWFEINNSADNYRVYMQNDSVAALALRTQVLANDGTGGLFTFRNGAAGNDLNNVNFGSGNGQTTTTIFDNVYVDTAGFNSANPAAVPEPSTLALLGTSLAAGAILRRKKR